MSSRMCGLLGSSLWRWEGRFCKASLPPSIVSRQKVSRGQNSRETTGKGTSLPGFTCHLGRFPVPHQGRFADGSSSLSLVSTPFKFFSVQYILIMKSVRQKNKQQNKMKHKAKTNKQTNHRVCIGQLLLGTEPTLECS